VVYRNKRVCTLIRRAPHPRSRGRLITRAYSEPHIVCSLLRRCFPFWDVRKRACLEARFLSLVETCVLSLSGAHDVADVRALARILHLCVRAMCHNRIPRVQRSTLRPPTAGRCFLITWPDRVSHPDERAYHMLEDPSSAHASLSQRETSRIVPVHATRARLSEAGLL
jgi:hypothetical protein